MILHVLPGDAIVEAFREANIPGEIIVCRECLIEGPVAADNLYEFWKQRREFLETVYPESKISFAEQVVGEFVKLVDLPEETEVNLWFEHELFCQVNMWFCLRLLRETKAKVFRVAPMVKSDDDIWNGFGEDLDECFSRRMRLEPQDIEFGIDLWRAYQNGDNDELLRLSEAGNGNFQYLCEVCLAAAEKETRPREIINQITSSGVNDFDEVFTAFRRKAGIYGFGDLQVKRIYESEPPA